MSQNSSSNTLSEILKLKSKLSDLISAESLAIEVAREMIRDEIKQHIKQKLDANPALRKELKDAIGMYYEAKIKETFATIKIAKACAKLGLDLIPEKLRKEMSLELELELGKLFERTL
jgi:type I site-specific restriction-modification system R (restriction) subunit